MDRFLADLGIPGSWLAALQLDLQARLVLAAVLGGVVGLEREVTGPLHAQERLTDGLLAHPGVRRLDRQG